MSIRNRMKKSRANLAKRHKQQVVNKDSRGRFPSIIMLDKLPAGVEKYKVGEGNHLIDILPWPAGKNMPLEGSMPITDEGEFDYVLDIWVHMGVGPLNEPFVCPYENFGNACPICEYIKANQLEKDDWKSLKAKRRVIYLLWAHSPREQERKGVQILEISHFAMEEKIAAIAELPEGGGYERFSDPDNGKRIAFQRKGSGMGNTQYLGHRFIERSSPIPDAILDQVFSIDSVVKMHPDYESIEKAFSTMRDKLESSGSVESNSDAGSNFDHSTGDDVPDFDFDSDGVATSQADDFDEPKKSTAKKSGKRIVRKRKVLRKR